MPTFFVWFDQFFFTNSWLRKLLHVLLYTATVTDLCLASELYKNPVWLCCEGEVQFHVPDELSVERGSSRVVQLVTDTGEGYVLTRHTKPNKTGGTAFYNVRNLDDHNRGMVFVGLDGIASFLIESAIHMRIGAACDCNRPGCLTGVRLSVSSETFTAIAIENEKIYQISVIFEGKLLTLTVLDYSQPSNYVKVAYRKRQFTSL